MSREEEHSPYLTHFVLVGAVILSIMGIVYLIVRWWKNTRTEYSQCQMPPRDDTHPTR